MEIVKLIVAALIAAIPLKLFEEAFRKKIAKENGLEPDSYESFKREAAILLKRVLAFLMVSVPIYGWFISQSAHDYGKWLEGAKGLLTDLAKFSPRLLAAFGLVTLPILFVWVIAILLTNGKESRESRSIWHFAKKCLKGCGYIFLVSVLFIELACVAKGGNDVIDFFKSITLADCFSYAYIAVVLGSALGTVLMAYLVVTGFKPFMRDLKKAIARLKAAIEAKKVKKGNGLE